MKTRGDVSDASGLLTLADAAVTGAAGEDQLDDNDADCHEGTNSGAGSMDPESGNFSGNNVEEEVVVEDASAGVTLQAHIEQNQN